MTIQAHNADRPRYLVLHGSAGDVLPDALVAKLRDEAVACGWVRASGVLADVELRAYDAERSTLGEPRRIAGPVQALVIEGSVGLRNGDASVVLRAVLARETDRGLETLAGEIESARTVAFEAVVTAFDELTLEHGQDAAAGVLLLHAPSNRAGASVASTASTASASTSASATAQAPAPRASWSTAVDASTDTDRGPRPRPAVVAPPQAPANLTMPVRPRPPAAPESEIPDPGSLVDHFAFGPCDVVKTEGDRLHVRLHKDGRIREIALEMLRVTRLPDAAGKPYFKLERRM